MVRYLQVSRPAVAVRNNFHHRGTEDTEVLLLFACGALTNKKFLLCALCASVVKKIFKLQTILNTGAVTNLRCA